METLSIDIVNPDVKKILYDLAELKLIVINESPDFQSDYKTLLEKLRNQKETGPSPEEIQKDVESVRNKRYASGKI